MYNIMKQHRKTATIQVDDALNIIVKVPQSMSQAQIEAFIKKYEAWIQETLQKKKLLFEQADWMKTGEILYLGKPTAVRIEKVAYAKEKIILTEEGFKLVTSGDEAKMRKAMELFLKERATILFTQLTEKYAKQVEVTFNKITIRKQQTRWGSCSTRGNLSYNVKLMCAPIEMIEYVILHEVMHLKHFNHGELFWKEIEEIMPKYKNYMYYFKEFGQNFII